MQLSLQSINHSHHRNEESHTLQQSCYPSPPQAATNLLPVPLDLLILEILHNNGIIRYVIFDFCVTHNNIFRKIAYVRVSVLHMAEERFLLWLPMLTLTCCWEEELLCVKLCPSFRVKAHFHSSRSFLGCLFHFEETARMFVKESPSFCISHSLVKF